MRGPHVTWKQILLTLLLAGAGFLFLRVFVLGRTIEAQVVDAQTGQPIAGAAVVGAWTKMEGWIVGMPVEGVPGRPGDGDRRARSLYAAPALGPLDG